MARLIAWVLVVPMAAACSAGPVPTPVATTQPPSGSGARKPTQVPGSSAGAPPVHEAEVFTSQKARETCSNVADGFAEDAPAPLTVVGAIDTDVAGLGRATVSAVSFDAAGGDNPSRWPDLGPNAAATLCFIDGTFDEASQALGTVVDRIVVGYAENPADGSSSAVVIDYGSRDKISVKAP